MKTRKMVFLGAACALLLGLAATGQARVTEKVEAMIAENSPLKINDNDLWIQIGGPLVYGIQYDKYASAHVMLGMGAGTYMDGISVDLQVKYNFINGKFTPFVAGGPVYYYTDPKKNLFALNLVFGLGYTFDSGLGLSLGVAYVKALTESEEPFSSQWVNDSINWVSPQFGLHWNF